MLGFLPLLNLLDLFLTLDTSPLVPFGSCDGTSIFLHANVGLRLEGKKGSKQKSIIFLLWKKKKHEKPSMAHAGLCLSGSGLMEIRDVT